MARKHPSDSLVSAKVNISMHTEQSNTILVFSVTVRDSKYWHDQLQDTKGNVSLHKCIEVIYTEFMF